MVPRLFRVFVNDNLWHEYGRIVQSSRMEEVHIRQFRRFLQHRTAAFLTESATYSVSTIGDLVPKLDSPGDFRLIDWHRKLGGVAGTRDSLTLSAMANERESGVRCCSVPNAAASALAGDSFSHGYLTFRFWFRLCLVKSGLSYVGPSPYTNYFLGMVASKFVELV